MFPRVTKAKIGGKEYRHLKIIRTYRDKGKVKQQVVASLGSLDEMSTGDIDNIINGLCRIFERPLPGGDPLFEEALSYGDVHVILHLWKELRLAEVLKREAEKSRTQFDLEAHVKTLVVNRLSDPSSKLAALSWLEHAYLPGVNRDEMKYHHLLRAMDWLIEQKETVERDLCNTVLTLFDQELDLVFYDLTSSYFETELTDELRKYGYSRDHRSDRPQITVGMVTTRDGIPVCHHVFPGNTLDKTTVKAVVRDLKERFPISRAVFVGDRGMLSHDNLEAVREEGLDYIVAVSARSDADTADLLIGFEDEVDSQRAVWREDLQRYRATGELPEGIASEDELLASHKLFGVDIVSGRRLVVEHSENVARVTARKRHERVKRVDDDIGLVLARLETQDRGQKLRGRKLSESGALVKVHDLLKKQRLTGPYRLELKDGALHIVFDQTELDWEAVLDGKLVVETSLIDFSPEEVIQQYRDLKHIEASFRVLKSAIELRPMHHWSPERIKSHVFICVLALVIERVMRLRLKNAGQNIEPSRALEKLRALRVIRAKTAKGAALGLTRTTNDQRSLLTALGVPAPTLNNIM
jgi:transposase